MLIYGTAIKTGTWMFSKSKINVNYLLFIIGTACFWYHLKKTNTRDNLKLKQSDNVLDSCTSTELCVKVFLK